MKKDNFEELEVFLGGTFHQDIENPKVALQQYIDEVENDWLRNISKAIGLFLDSNLSNIEKEEFITSNTEIYFPAIGMPPTKWLIHVADTINNKLNNMKVITI